MGREREGKMRSLLLLLLELLNKLGLLLQVLLLRQQKVVLQRHIHRLVDPRGVVTMTIVGRR